MKQQCSEAIARLIIELEKCFPTHELFNIIGVIYPQYWHALKAKIIFPDHMAILQTHFGYKNQ
jgi:hypothetical protein